MKIHGSSVSTENITQIYLNKGAIISVKKSEANDQTQLNLQTHVKMNCMSKAMKSVSETQSRI